jgi:hypothetical protein
MPPIMPIMTLRWSQLSGSPQKYMTIRASIMPMVGGMVQAMRPPPIPTTAHAAHHATAHATAHATHHAAAAHATHTTTHTTAHATTHTTHAAELAGGTLSDKAGG